MSTLSFAMGQVGVVLEESSAPGTVKTIVNYDKLPLAVYREIAAHLQQVAGVTTRLIPQSSQTFDYTQSQVEGLELNYPADLSPGEKRLLTEILDYYQQRYKKL